MTDDEERRIIRDAMERLISGKPIRSDGKLTIKSLAAEADVKRWLLTHKHKNLQEEFRARVAQQGRVPEAQKKLLEENLELRSRVKRLSQELKQAGDELQRYARIVHVQTLEHLSLEKSFKELSDELVAQRQDDKPN